MRNRREAKELRGDESLLDAEGLPLGKHPINFYSAADDEEGSKDTKLRWRREQRRQKQRLRHAG